ncbi:hypothetical protein GCM10027444_39970 [Actinopolyspora lacussalsi]
MALFGLGFRAWSLGGTSGTALAAGPATSGSDLHNVSGVLARAAPENPRRRRLRKWWGLGLRGWWEFGAAS